MLHTKKYIPNDLYLDQQSQQIIILTGPIWRVKSAVPANRTIALMAQIGRGFLLNNSNLSIVDKLSYTGRRLRQYQRRRIDLHGENGNETASIMNNLTDQSLILLDEIGAGAT